MSKIHVALVGILLLSAGLQGLWSAPQQADPAVLLRAAIEKEEVVGDLNAAIEQYKQVIKIAGTDRAVAAQALLRLGGCYEKRGPEEARQAYQQLIRDYAEQTREVAAARQRLAALVAGPSARAAGSGLLIRKVRNLDMFAKPSPDGKYLAFTDWNTGNLAILDVATGATRALTKDASLGASGGYAMFSAWARDSRQIVCVWYSYGAGQDVYELRVLSVAGDAQPQTIAVPRDAWIEPLDWSPDGMRILCLSTSWGKAGFVFATASSRTIGTAEMNFPSVPDWPVSRLTGDGHAVLYSAPASGPGSPSDIFLRDLTTGTITAIVQHPSEDLLVGVLPDGDWLLSASDRRGSLDMWAVPLTVDKDEAEPVLLKPGLGRIYPLGLTNDGRYYYATLSATDDIYLADVSLESGRITGEARKLTTRWDGSSAHPRFSPDGEHLAYVVRRGAAPLPMRSFSSLAVQSLRSQSAEPIVVGFDEFGLNDVRFPCWLPGGKSLVVRGRAGQQVSGLFRLDLPDLRKRQIYSGPPGRGFAYYDCSNTEAAAYLVESDAGEPPKQPDLVLRVDAEGGTPKEVFRTSIGERLSSIALSPDGTRLSMISRLDRVRRAVLVMPTGGGVPQKIFEFSQPSGAWPSHGWSPDGRFIQVVDGPEDGKYSVLQVRADGKGTGAVTTYQRNQQFFGLTYHPSGRLVAFTARNQPSAASEVWVMENLREEIRLLTKPGKRP